ncbi:5-methyltetrahydropteroyltriglutamate--homocysteine S-methyltransferase [Microbacterium sp. MYb72]|uniref:5-methyltetrahydropteroyltriglutamate-- homocysteine S-methyltransferase n=1 Tax=Microbacterium sp. MYb72 TaxID=1848693 RepID=UPI000CFCD158|nr:5-methyltetrahydropteroyltriglutamate--homocysteine S-methyltransferase [Microbacterium sp. MYb72]PRB12862.1 5-methyltetrahydropteroyltriglutamate--homocysteine S-methyltransferase [Microbacterium sp. MYb72]
MSAFPEGTILGYPRIGRRRELKKAVEAFWAGRTDLAELEATSAELRAATRERLAALGLGRTDSAIPESFSYYDQVLDAAVTVGAIPARFEDLRSEDGTIGLPAYFTVARGEGERAPLEMTKWFDSNYHYLVPEIGPETVFSLSSDRVVREFAEGAAAGFTTRPVIVGPVTLLALAKASDDAPEGFDPLSRLDDLLPVYVELLARLKDAGAEWVQLDEPALVSESLPASIAALSDAAGRALGVLGGAAARPSILVAAPYADLGEVFPVLAAAPIEAIAVDLVRGGVPAGAAGLEGKILVGGVVDGHNIWRGDLASAFDTLEALRALGAAGVSASTSTSLLHVPHDVTDETKLDARLVSWLAFADQKVEQVVALARGLAEGRAAVAADLDAASAALQDRLSAPGVRDGAVRARALTEADFSRVSYEERESAQEALGLPALPLTTIGSFPQTGDIRRARARFTRGEIPAEDYEEFLRREVASVVSLQEDLGLDVLVHGEPERNDMVQYFAENLDGFDVTENGWVQSYGSRATRPSLLWGDVSRPAPITVDWSTYAQSLTTKHMKGMLTGPVTILAWSFVRDDQPLGETANQVALALRDEIADLEAAGIAIIQVDEPALRELLPLKKADQSAYLQWSVDSFRLATGGAAAGTQVHTHLCYSEFGVVIDAIRALDADVTSIEAARSRMEVVADIAEVGFDHGIGPGVYDIHSPRVPSAEEVESLLRRAVDEIPTRQLWVNPDCGLKTRGYDETVASLRNIVEATRRVREDVVVAV